MSVFEDMSKQIREVMQGVVDNCEVCQAYQKVSDHAHLTHVMSDYPDKVGYLWRYHLNKDHMRLDT